MSNRPTIHDVAFRANVSPATVSRLINGTARVRERTESAIKQAMDDLGYVPSRLAQSFARGSSRTVALCVDGEGQSAQHNEFLMTVALGLHDVLADADYSVRIVNGRRMVNDARQGQTTWVQSAWNRQEFDGVIITNPTVRDPLIEAVVVDGIPAVVIGRSDEASGLAQVDVDNVGGTRLVTAHLVELGHERVAFLRPAVAMTAVSDRIEGYLEALARIGVRPPGDWVLASGGIGLAAFSFESARVAVAEADWNWTALVAFNDEMALGAIRALEDRGISVPEEVSVVGFDDLPYARMVKPSLSTVHQDIRQLGQHAGRALLFTIRGKSVADLTIQTVSFVKRESTAPTSVRHLTGVSG